MISCPREEKFKREPWKSNREGRRPREKNSVLQVTIPPEETAVPSADNRMEERRKKLDRGGEGLIYLGGDSPRGGSCSESPRRSLNFEVKPLGR